MKTRKEVMEHLTDLITETIMKMEDGERMATVGDMRSILDIVFIDLQIQVYEENKTAHISNLMQELAMKRAAGECEN